MVTAVPVGYLKMTMESWDIASYDAHDYVSVQGLLNLDRNDYPGEYLEDRTIDLAVSVGYNTAFLPVTHNKTENYSSYTYCVYTTANGTAVTPAHSVTVNIPENYDTIDTVILF